MTQTATTQAVMDIVRRSQGCDLEDIVRECPGLTWNQVFLEIDRLSRSGEVALIHQGACRYRVNWFTKSGGSAVTHEGGKMERPRNPSVLYEVIENGQVVIEYWSGRVDRHDVEIHSKEHLSDARIVPGASALVEARKAQFGVALEDVSNVVDSLYTNYVGRLKVGKCAVLVNSNTYDLARAYERSASKYGINVIVFHDLDIACKWLGVRVETVLKSLDRMKAPGLTH